MRIIIIILSIIVLSCQSSLAQQALVKLQNGDSTEAYITSIDSTYLYTSDTNYILSDIEDVIFHKQKGRDIHLYYELADAGVNVHFDEEITFTEIGPSHLELQKDPLAQFKLSMNEYRKAHQIGAGLQLAGVLLGATGVLFNSGVIGGIGVGILAGGLVYEINASRHLNHLEY